ncbi:MFS transporter [Bradyrhizobium sp. WD16]|uniref:MFS transporter n=1 Tax=Bradyrhizobium sp. WD16 TaxID=1521768 RepID=UPI0020A2B399|nr:MFS transporter [Bradyrhizobium sp. WD16]UTD25814.1 MFS transporter [Bradyrhizobium sp. WD16]
MAETVAVSTAGRWRTPALIIACGAVIGMVTFGPRATLGFFLQPMSSDLGWGRDVFALALAVQNLLWGLGQPFAGAVADRFGSVRVIATGALLYAAGLLTMRYATSPSTLTLSAGVLVGFGLSGCSFNLVLAAFSKLVPPARRNLALGIGTAAGSLGQFLFAPVSVALIDAIGWRSTLVIFSALMLIVVPLSLVLATPPARSGEAGAGAEPDQSITQALAEAFGHRSYVLLVLGFFTCGFQLAFVTAHLPAYLVDRGMPAQTGGWVLAVIGLFNIVGSIGVGWISTYFPRRYILSAIYFARALSTVIFISFPITTFSALAYGVVTGVTWLSTVPPTSSLIALMFGTRWLATLYGFAFVSHQVGGFLGALLGGIAFDRTGSYDVVWWLSVLFGVLSALINLPIVERPVARPAAVPA